MKHASAVFSCLQMGANESPVALQERLPAPALWALTHTCAAEAFLGWPGSPPTVEG